MNGEAAWEHREHRIGSCSPGLVRTCTGEFVRGAVAAQLQESCLAVILSEALTAAALCHTCAAARTLAASTALTRLPSGHRGGATGAIRVAHPRCALIGCLGAVDVGIWSAGVTLLGRGSAIATHLCGQLDLHHGRQR